jgi:hypothetical protein
LFGSIFLTLADPACTHPEQRMQLSEPKRELDLGPVQQVEPEEFDIPRKTLRVLAAVNVLPIERCGWP